MTLMVETRRKLSPVGIKKNKEYSAVDFPHIVKDYNKHMGGADLMYGLIGRYHIRMKTSEWTNRVFYHLIDVAMVNAYIFYHRTQKATER